MQLEDQLSKEAYDQLSGPERVYYSLDAANGLAHLDLRLNNVIQRSGLDKSKELAEKNKNLEVLLKDYQEFAETPEELAGKIKKWQDIEAIHSTEDNDLNQQIASLKEASDRKLAEELTKQSNVFKQKITELEKQNQEYATTINSINLWNKIQEIAGDLKPKFHQTFRDSFLKDFCLDEDGNLTLAGNDPESLLSKPAVKIDELRKKFPELFEQSQQQDFPSYNGNSRMSRDEARRAKEDYNNALKDGNVMAMRVAQQRIRG